jgi:hypothetical protein
MEPSRLIVGMKEDEMKEDEMGVGTGRVLDTIKLPRSNG